MHIQNLRGLVVIDPDSACRVGTVTDYWVDPVTAHVVALALHPVDLDLLQQVDARRVARVGKHAIMLRVGDGSAPARPKPVPETWLDRRHLTMLLVYTDAGELLGRVTGAHISNTTLAVETYDIAPVEWWRRWLPHRHGVVAGQVAWCGRDVIVVRTDEPAKLRPVGRESGESGAQAPAA